MGIDVMHEPPQDVLDAARWRRAGLGPRRGDGGSSRSCPGRPSSAVPTGPSRSTMTGRTRSAACGPSSATTACSCGRSRTSPPTGTGSARSRGARRGANYIRAGLTGIYPEVRRLDARVVFSGKNRPSAGCRMDIAKRLMDYGFHHPRSFPLIVHGALMIEPTETEEGGSRRLHRRDAGDRPAEEDPHHPPGPHDACPSSGRSRGRAEPVLRWRPEDARRKSLTAPVSGPGSDILPSTT
jgi:hypothetical protein